MSKFLAIFGKPRYLGIVTGKEDDDELINGDIIVAESYRGEELAVVAGKLSEKQEKEYRILKNSTESSDGIKSSEPVVTDLAFIKFATENDLDLVPEYREEEKEIFKLAKELLKPHKLDMKLIDVEYLRKKRKLFFYFSSDQRVDFRAYVRDLAREFKTRIELRQIGVRDEAKIIRGIAPCGQRCCCSYWLHQFLPINIRMVKEQNLALNPSKISGICGRLMCCMHYEHNVYHDMWAKLPNPGAKIKTPNGNVIVAGIDLQTESVRCFVPGRGEMKIVISQFEEFKQTMIDGKEWNLAGDNSEEDSGAGLPQGGRKQRVSAKRESGAGESAEDKRTQSAQREKRTERRGKPAEQVQAAEQKTKKKRRKRGRGGAQRAETASATDRAESQRPGQERKDVQQEDREAARKPRRPHRKRKSGTGETSEREGDN